MIIIRNEPATRLSNYSNFDGQPSGTLNSDYDKGTMQDLTLQEQVDRAILVSKGHPNADLPLTPLILKGNAGKRIVVNAGETDWELLAGSALSGSGTLNTIPLWTPDGNTLGDSIITESGATIAIAGSLTVADGTEAAPGIRLTSEAHGLFRLSSSQMGVSIAGTRALTIGSTGLTIVGILDATGNIITTNIVAATDIFVSSVNNDTNSASDAIVRIATGSAAAGDPHIQWEIQSAVQRYVMGIDNSDSDKLVISRGAVIGTTNVMEVTTAGAVTFKSTLTVDGLVTLDSATVTNTLTVSDGSEAAPGIRLTTDASGFYHASDGIMGWSIKGVERARLVSSGQFITGLLLTTGEIKALISTAGTTIPIRAVHSDNTNAASHATVLIQTGGTSGGDPFSEWTIDGVQSYVAGIDNSDSDKFVGSVGTAIGTANWLEVTSAGAVTLANALATGNVTVTGTLSTTGLATLDSAAVTNNLDAATLGGGTPGTGAFTTLSTSGLATLDSLTVTNNLIMSTGDLTLSAGDLAITGVCGIGQSASATHILRTASGGAAVYAAHFYRNVTTSSVPVVRIFQDHSSGNQAVLELKQDDTSEGFIDFVGTAQGAIATSTTDSDESVNIEINGVVHKIPAYL